MSGLTFIYLTFITFEANFFVDLAANLDVVAKQSQVRIRHLTQWSRGAERLTSKQKYQYEKIVYYSAHQGSAYMYVAKVHCIRLRPKNYFVLLSWNMNISSTCCQLLIIYQICPSNLPLLCVAAIHRKESFGGFRCMWLTTLLQSSMWRKVLSNRGKWSKFSSHRAKH